MCCQHGKQLHCNYQLSKLVPKKLEGTNLTEHKVSCLYIVCRHRVSLTSDQLHIHLYICVCVCEQCKSEASLVAMDFSGKTGGRVIQNSTEAQIAEKEEGQAWRVRMEGQLNPREKKRWKLSFICVRSEMSPNNELICGKV